MIIGNDIGDTAHATGNQGLQEGAPVHFGLGERTGNTEHPAALVGADADHREHGGVAHHATLSDFLIARVEEQVADLAQRPVAPGIQLPIQELGGAADLARRQALQAELAHHRLGVTGGDAFDIHLRHGQHDSAAGAPSALQGLGVKRRLMTGGLGNLEPHRTGRGVDLLGSGAVGVSPPLGRADGIVAGAQERLSRNQIRMARLKRPASDRRAPGGMFSLPSLRSTFHQRTSTARILEESFRISPTGSPAHPFPIQDALTWRTKMTDRPAPGYTPARGEAKFPDLTVHDQHDLLGRVFLAVGIAAF